MNSLDSCNARDVRLHEANRSASHAAMIRTDRAFRTGIVQRGLVHKDETTKGAHPITVDPDAFRGNDSWVRFTEEMMTKRISSELIRRQAEELHRFTVSEERASELAGEVETINSAAFDAAQELDFEDEPVAFARLLRATKPEAPTDG